MAKYISEKILQCLQFPVVVPNKTTAETFKKTDAGEEIVVCKNTKEMFDNLGI